MHQLHRLLFFSLLSDAEVDFSRPRLVPRHSRMSAIFPPEIWDAIVKLACTDGGKTGCALSLVSRYIRDVSHSSRLQSIALDGLEAMQDIVFELDRRAPKECAVRFVYLKNMILTPEEHQNGVWPLGSPWQTTYDQFFAMISPTVEVLTVDAEPHWRDRTCSLSPTPRVDDRILYFPCLRSLTSCSTTLAFMYFSRDDPTRTAPSHSRMPMLEHLHFFSDVYSSGPNDPFYRILLQQMPSLTHLRVSDVSGDDDGIIGALGYMTGVPKYRKFVENHIEKVHQFVQMDSISMHEGIFDANMGARPEPLQHLSAIIIDYVDKKAHDIMGRQPKTRIFQLMHDIQGYCQIQTVVFRYSGSSRSGGLHGAWQEMIHGGLGAWDMQNASGDLIFSAPPRGRTDV
jgi:hypothetical protein